jgi:hypothetical protein
MTEIIKQVRSLKKYSSEHNFGQVIHINIFDEISWVVVLSKKITDPKILKLIKDRARVGDRMNLSQPNDIYMYKTVFETIKQHRKNIEKQRVLTKIEADSNPSL